MMNKLKIFNVMANIIKPIFFVILALLHLSVAQTQMTAPEQVMGASGYPLPRFMSLDDEITNMRTGPGLEYPIDWIYQREDYPLKVIAEYGNWFKVIDIDGSTGWILRHLLSLKRTALVVNGSQELLRSPNERTAIAVIAEQGVQGTLIQCENNWCEMEVGGLKGWIESRNLWGALEQEAFD